MEYRESAADYKNDSRIYCQSSVAHLLDIFLILFFLFLLHVFLESLDTTKTMA